MVASRWDSARFEACQHLKSWCMVDFLHGLGNLFNGKVACSTELSCSCTLPVAFALQIWALPTCTRHGQIPSRWDPAQCKTCQHLKSWCVVDFLHGLGNLFNWKVVCSNELPVCSCTLSLSLTLQLWALPTCARRGQNASR